MEFKLSLRTFSSRVPGQVQSTEVDSTLKEADSQPLFGALLLLPLGSLMSSLAYCSVNQIQKRVCVCIASMYIVTNCYIMTRLINCSSGKSTEFIQRTAFGSVVLLQYFFLAFFYFQTFHAIIGLIQVVC